MKQSRISIEDQQFRSIFDYMKLMVEEAMMDESELPNLCGECAQLGIPRPAIFGEDYCEPCWNGGWERSCNHAA